MSVAGDAIIGARSITADSSNIATVSITYPYVTNDLGGAASGITGPVSSTSNAIVRWNGITGDTVQNSSVTISDTGTVFIQGISGTVTLNTVNITANRTISWPDSNGTLYIIGGTDVAIADGGTGASTAANARTNLGLVIGTDIQAFDNDLTDIAALTHSASAMIVSDGTDWLSRTPTQVRTDLGLTIGTNVQAWDNDLDDLAALSHSASAFIISNGTDWLSRTQSQAINDLGGTATVAQINTGTNSTAFMTGSAFVHSNYGVRVVEMQITGTTTAMSLGDGVGIFRIPSVMNDFVLIGVAAQVYTAGTTNAAEIQIRNKTDAVDMLSTKLFIDSTEVDSSTAATAYVINTANDDVTTGDLIAIDVDAVHGSAASGLVVELQFRKE